MKNRWHLLLPVCALLFQPVPILFIRAVAWMAYSPSPWLPADSFWTVTLIGLTLCGVISLLLGGLGVYLLLTRSRRSVALPLIVMCCVPALVIGMVYVRAVLVFLAMV
jgi:hypothetical protein